LGNTRKAIYLSIYLSIVSKARTSTSSLIKYRTYIAIYGTKVKKLFLICGTNYSTKMCYSYCVRGKPVPYLLNSEN